MKKWNKFFPFALLTLSMGFLVIGCQEEMDPSKKASNGKISFSFENAAKADDQRSLNDTLQVNQMLISIEDSIGNPVFDRRKIEVYEINGDYISENIQLREGQYHLTEFLVLYNNEVLYAAPKSGSEYANYVVNPLPLGFRIKPDTTHQINPEVLRVSDNITGEKIGYATFSFNIVEDTTMNPDDVYNLDSGLIAYYPFNGNVKDSMDNYDGTRYGGLFVEDRFGRANNALDFDGIDDYISLPTDFDLPKKSLSVWFKAHNIGNNPDPNYLGTGIITNDYYGLDNGVMAVSVRDEDGGLIHLRGGSNSSDHWEPLVLDSLYHAAMIFNGDSIQYYLNGKHLKSYPMTYGHSNDGGPNTIVGRHRNPSGYFDGVIDDIRIYDRPLKELEVKRLYNLKK